MPGSTPAEAAWNFVQALQRALSAVTQERLNYAGADYRRPEPRVLSLGNGDPTPLGGPSHLYLTFAMHYRVVLAEGERGSWKVQTEGYLYGLDGRDGREVLGYHWHPHGRSPVVTPHLHLGAGALVGHSDLNHAHLPTGRIALEQVLRLAITDLGVRPLRENWDQVLEETQGAFERWRTWPSPAPPS